MTKIPITNLPIFLREYTTTIQSNNPNCDFEMKISYMQVR